MAAAERAPTLRADLCVVAQGLAQSRSQAQALIMAGAIYRADSAARIDKAGTPLRADVILTRRGEPQPFVSRGGQKLHAALGHFAVDAAGRTCLDVGASTGGFTDCLLQAGAKRVYAVDVGTNQLAYRLRQDTRVICMEQVNMRLATPELLPERVSLVVADVSFISLTQVLPAACAAMAPAADLLALVKPQFEAGRAHVGKGGIVRCAAAWQAAVSRVTASFAAMGLVHLGTMDSPILGAGGNREYIVHAHRGPV